MATAFPNLRDGVLKKGDWVIFPCMGILHLVCSLIYCKVDVGSNGLAEITGMSYRSPVNLLQTVNSVFFNTSGLVLPVPHQCIDVP